MAKPGFGWWRWRNEAATVARSPRLLLLVTLLTSVGPLMGGNARAAEAGPAVVAKADLQLWPDAISSVAGFDRASRAALLLYVTTLRDMRSLRDEEMLARFRIKSLNRAGVDKWLNQEEALALRNYRLAAADCTAQDWSCLGPIASAAELADNAPERLNRLPAALRPWQANFSGFLRAYAAEQMRLAALFPRVSSEIDTFDNAREWTGDAVADRQFFLTFDDGPSPQGSNSDATLTMLAAQKKSAAFFVLGASLQARLRKSKGTAVTQLYGQQCVASHGWEHQSHARWESWQASVRDTQALLRASLPAGNVLPLFRPPYGQRRADSAAFFAEEGLKVALWNIDSQDWNHQVGSQDIGNRILALMLVKRHGVLLFHDVHAKAATALPEVFAALGPAVEWPDCHQLKAL